MVKHILKPGSIARLEVHQPVEAKGITYFRERKFKSVILNWLLGCKEEFFSSNHHRGFSREELSRTHILQGNKVFEPYALVIHTFDGKRFTLTRHTESSMDALLRELEGKERRNETITVDENNNRIQ
jgi:hypothetical protein